MSVISRTIVAGSIMAAGLVVSAPAPAVADSCWTHNGSIMRLEARGDKRWITYERPRRVLRESGVGPGTLLFEGRRNGNTYTGTSRVFSKFCPGEPQVYRVSGPVSRGQTRVTLYGEREIHDRCRPTGRFTEDVLVFDYSHDC